MDSKPCARDQDELSMLDEIYADFDGPQEVETALAAPSMCTKAR